MPVDFTFTEAAINAASRECIASRRQRDIADPSCRGLVLRLGFGGAKVWNLQCRDAQQKNRRFRLGEFPTMGVAEARREAADLRAQVRKGFDPIAEVRTVRAKAAGLTLAGFLDTYRAEGKAADLANWPAYRRKIDLVFAALLDKPVALLSLREVQQAADGYHSRRTGEIAVQYLRPALRWGGHEARGLCPDALGRIQGKSTHNKRERVLSDTEAGAVLPVLRQPERFLTIPAYAVPYLRAMAVATWTLCRREEVAGMKWGEIDTARGVWRLPPSRRKGGVAHTIPLPHQALDFILAQKPAGNVEVHPLALIFPRTDGGPLTSWDIPTRAAMRASGTEGWTRHDLRRSGATMLGDLEVEPHIVEIALGHQIVRGAAAAYNHSRYLKPHREALQALADHLDRLVIAAAPRRALAGA